MENAFANLKTNKSSGYDNISADVVKTYSKRVFPDKLKIARLTPIFKKGNNTLVTNYRPTSVLLCFSKLLEHIMYNCLCKFQVQILLTACQRFTTVKISDNGPGWK